MLGDVASYQQFPDDDGEDAPQGGGVIHIMPESGTGVRWNHIEDLDSFFTRVYQYHKRQGFTCMAVEELLELVQFVFMGCLVLFLIDCVDYGVLFKTKPLNGTGKVTLPDGIYPFDQCVSNVGFFQWILIVIAGLFWTIRLFKVVINLFRYWDTKDFFNIALNINDYDLINVTWAQVLKKTREAQIELQMCIHKRDLSELDIYHRILRFKNYMVAMVNKGFLPPKFKLPFVGEIVYLSNGLKFNLEMLLFWGPWSPFDNWHLKEDYKKQQIRRELAEALERTILYAALFNCLLCPFILVWQIIHAVFKYTESLKREPSILGARRWSLHGKLYLRHFNELDHELSARLNKAYRPASKYVNSFTSPLLEIVSKFIMYIAGACLAVLLTLSIIDEDFLSVEHVLTLITGLSMIVATCRVCIPDENQVWWPEHLMSSVLAQVHYLPSHWRGNAHTITVRNEFTHLFQYKATYLLTELFSPIVTPILLVTHIRPRALEFVDFFRCFTVDVCGCGDVCSFAQMDIRAHGNPDWNPKPTNQRSNYMRQAEEGKLEMSLMYFNMNNPGWSPPKESGGFISTVKEEARKQLLKEEANHNQSTCSQSTDLNNDEGLQMQQYNNAIMSLINTSRAETQAQDKNNVCGHRMATPSLGDSVFGPTDPAEIMAMDMSINALYLHQAHQRNIGSSLLSSVNTSDVVEIANQTLENLSGNIGSSLLSSVNTSHVVEIANQTLENLFGIIERRGGARQLNPNVGAGAGHEKVPLLSSPSRFS